MGNRQSHNQGICDNIGQELHRSASNRQQFADGAVVSSSNSTGAISAGRFTKSASSGGLPMTLSTMLTTSRPAGGSSSLCSGGSQRPTLRFNQIHGENVALSRDRRVASRTESFCKALAFSDRAVGIDEVVCLRFSEVKTSWSGVLRFGVTNMDPATYGGNLPKYACPEMTSKEGTWAKAMSDRYCQEGNIMYFFVRENGEMYYGVNGILKGLFLSGINTRAPMYVVIDIYGNTTSIEFVDESTVVPLKRNREAQQQSVPPPPSIPPPTPPSDDVSPGPAAARPPPVPNCPPPIVACPPVTTASDSNNDSNTAPRHALVAPQGTSAASNGSGDRQGPQTTVIPTPAADHTASTTQHAAPEPVATPRSQEETAAVVAQQRLARELETRLSFAQQQQRSLGQPTRSETAELPRPGGDLIVPLQFHATHGRTVTLSEDRTIATRTATEYCGGYVFTNRPVINFEKIHIQVLNVEPAYAGGMGFGVTNCSPAQLSNFEFPDDSEELLNRPEFWAVSKDHDREPILNDEYKFYVSARGEVVFQKNNGPERTLMHVDPSLSYYMFFDVYARAQSLKICSSSNAMPRRPVVVQPTIPQNRRRQSQPHPHQSSSAHAVGRRAMNTAPTPAVVLQQFQETYLNQRPPGPNPNLTAQMAGQQRRRETSMPSSTSAGDNAALPPMPPGNNGAPRGRSGYGPAPPRPYPRPYRPPPPVPPQRTQSVPNTQSLASGTSTSGNVAVPPCPAPSNVAASSESAVAGPSSSALSGRGECTVCMDKPVNSAVYPCGHMCMCYECGRQTWNRQGVCPICRHEIRDIMRVFPSN